MNRYKYNEEKTIESLKELKNNQITFMGIIICIILIFFGITIAQISMIRELYDEYKPIEKECKCNNEIIIDTDTLTL